MSTKVSFGATTSSSDTTQAFGTGGSTVSAALSKGRTTTTVTSSTVSSVTAAAGSIGKASKKRSLTEATESDEIEVEVADGSSSKRAKTNMALATTLSTSSAAPETAERDALQNEVTTSVTYLGMSSEEIMERLKNDKGELQSDVARLEEEMKDMRHVLATVLGMRPGSTPPPIGYYSTQSSADTETTSTSTPSSVSSSTSASPTSSATSTPPMATPHSVYTTTGDAL